MSCLRLLLETHALLWWLTGHPALSEPAGEAIGDDTNEVFVSAASPWEVTTKARLGKLQAGPLARDFGAELPRQGFVPLPITVSHARRAGSIPGTHRDPFDRMLIAQAQALDLVLVSKAGLFDSYGVRRLW